MGRLGYRFKRRMLGQPLRTEQLDDERLGKPTALAVFASDNLSSSAYATEEILRAAFACGRIGGRDAGGASVTAGSLMFGYALTEPHFRWTSDNDRDITLLFVLFLTSIAAKACVQRRER